MPPFAPLYATTAQVRLWLGASLGRTSLRPRTPEQAMEDGIIAINRLWVRILAAPAAQRARKSLRQSTGAARRRHKLESNARAAASRRDRADPRLAHHSSICPLSDFPFALQPSTAQDSPQPCPGGIHLSVTLGCFLPQTRPALPRLATHLQSPARPEPSRTLAAWRSPPLLTQLNSNPIPELDKLPLQSLLRRHSYHTLHSKVYFFNINVVAPHVSQQ
jgi:hypothetical protein